MTRFDTPEGRFADYLVDEQHRKTTLDLANLAWETRRSYRDRVVALAEAVRDRVTTEIFEHAGRDTACVTLTFVKHAADRFDWGVVAEFVAEELDMHGT